MLRLLALSALSAVLASCNCGTNSAASVPCATDSECTGAEKCIGGTCSSVSADAGSDDILPDGPDAGDVCVLACGTGCCRSGEVCEANECHKDCGAQTRCGASGAESCCAANQLCYFEQCVTPGADCTTSTSCQKTEYCEPSVGKCLPLAATATCEYRPPAGQFSPGVLWTSAPALDAYPQVMMAPIVIDVNADGVPDVLANYFTGGSYGGSGVMKALSGDDGRLLWTTPDVASDQVHPAASIAAADLDGSGKIVAVTVAADGTLVAFDAKTGTRLWNSHTSAGAAATCSANWGGPSIADLDQDGVAEIVCGLAAFDHNGVQLWNSGLGAGAVGPLTAVVDLDGDTKLDVTDGARAFKGDGTPLGWTGTGAGGFPAIGDFIDASGALGRDGKPEIVTVNGGKVALVNGQTGALLASLKLPSWDGATCASANTQSPGNGGPPTIADFDGDQQPEVGVADLDCYTVFKLKSSGGTLAWDVLWSKKVQDHSSSVTGSSVFDFEGDGKAEMVYADEVFLHVFNGADGNEIFSKKHCSGTTYETPVIVDVNGNGRADIVICENTYAGGGLGCDAAVKPGIQVINDAKDNWVNTRAIWNQHTYHVTNVCDGQDRVCGDKGAPGNAYARVPKTEPNSWTFNNAPPGSTAPPLNSYRQNVQGDGLFNAPDLTASAPTVDRSKCPTTLKLSVRVQNKGALGVLPGVKVAFYAEGMPAVLLGVGATKNRLLPGESETVTLEVALPAALKSGVSIFAVVDDDGTGKGASSECDETNNRSTKVQTACSGPS